MTVDSDSLRYLDALRHLVSNIKSNQSEFIEQL